MLKFIYENLIDFGFKSCSFKDQPAFFIPKCRKIPLCDIIYATIPAKGMHRYTTVSEQDSSFVWK